MQAASSARLSSAGGADLGRLERQLDRLPLRNAERLAAVWRQQRRRHAVPVPRAPLPQCGPAASIEELVAALEQALLGGALESAGKLAHRLEPLLPGRVGPSIARAQALLLETLLIFGDVERARDVSRDWTQSLKTTVRGSAMLELLGSDASGPWLPDRKPHLLHLSRGLERGAFDADGLAGLLGSSRLPWLRAPELHLLFYNALRRHDRPGAERFLNRFLALHGLSRVSLREPDERNVLDSFRFRVEVPQPGGPLISVLVSAYNAAKTLVSSVESLLLQSHARLEILVCDDASSDGSLELVKQRFAAEPRVRLFRSTANQGAYNVRNALAARARGDVLTFHDADDLALPERLARQVRRLRGRAVACVTNLLRVVPDGRVVFFKDQKATRLCPVSLMLRKSTFEALGGFRAARVGADWELYCKLLDRFGPDAVERITAPCVLGLWAQGSATQTLGTESLEDGYRSPARRGYSELVFAQRAEGPTKLAEAEVDARLVECGNLAPRSEVVDVK